MRERGNKLNRYLDFFIGIPLVWFAAAFRRVSHRKATEPAYAAEGGWEQTKSAAIICLGAVGDTVLLSALIKALAGKNLKLDIYVSASNSGLGKLLPPVNTIYSFPLNEIPRMILHIRRQKYHYLLDSSPWARLPAIIAALSDAGVTVGFDTERQYRAVGYDIKVPHHNDRHEWRNFLALGQALFPEMQAVPGLRIPNIVIDYHKPYIICHMWPAGSNCRPRLWPEKKWTELILELIHKGFYILLSGSPADKAANDVFITSLPSRYREGISLLVGDLVVFAGTAAQAAAVISVNTGSMHIASLMNVPTVGLHGPTSPLRWGPVGRNSIALQPAGAHTFLNLGFEKLQDDSAYCYRLEIAQVKEALVKLGVL